MLAILNLEEKEPDGELTVGFFDRYEYV